ncbi:glycosyltransferase family 39 protein [Nodosilinea sp. LEGE 07088]|uniref:glycosyltransferase family 39 protein n=1 Tax=Nodosilinea sp. LEGE 07088 TaxID=2777968 RepID=UPI00188035A0|nr:glycosyltransferase family 39 protein [Nodosilinea sp. LEGE 07088]MBE9138919.1 glycosyltransferase family 39 protein [Nodosilinea sp. LEGE 07088]
MTHSSSPKLSTWRRDSLILVGLWLAAAAIDRLWIFIDHAPPAWDQGDHLARALNHWWVLQNPNWLSGDWWRTLWQQAPTQRAPLVSLATVPFFALWGASPDIGVTVNLVFTAVLLRSIYLTGRRLFSPRVGLWAAALSLLAPILATLRLEYLLDYALVAMVAFTLMGLTYWWTAQKSIEQWLFTLLWGVGVGLMLLTRTSGLLFLIAALGWPALLSLYGRRWGRLIQLAVGLGIGLLVIWPWFSTSWLTIISTTVESTAHGVIYRRDPQANTLAGWLYYPQQLPAMVSPPVLFLALATGLIALVAERLGKRSQPSAPSTPPAQTAWLWLGGIVILTLVLGALGSNKQPRLMAPVLPLLLVALASLLAWRRAWVVQWVAAIGAVGLVLWTVFPLPGAPLGPGLLFPASFFPYTGARWPNEDIVATMTQTTPHLESNLGMAVNTQQLNPQNMDFYGGSADFQAFARQLAWNPDTAEQDAAALDWYLTKTGDQGAYETIEAGQALLKDSILNSPDLEVVATWPLPDDSEAQLYHRRRPPIAVMPAETAIAQVELQTVEAPTQVSPGQIYPVTYRLAGPWDALKEGLLLLTWQPESGDAPVWISDHAVGWGRLYGQHGADPYTVEERLTLAPPADLPSGRYTLAATLLQPATGDRYDVTAPITVVQVQPSVSTPAPVSAPPLDLVTYLHQLAQGLAVGELDPIFAEVGRINQYDPRQQYLVHTEQTLGDRLQRSPDRLDWLYGKLLAQILQQHAQDAIATLNQITTVAPDNPYHWAYLGFVHLYAWQPRQAQVALDQAAALDPDLPNLKLLQAVAAAMQLQIPRAISLLQAEGVL